MEINNILVPIDFSKCSKNALLVAIDIAKATKAKIHMINAVHVHTPHPDFTGGTLIDAIIVDYETQVKESFKELESEMVELQEVPHEAERFISYLTDAIYTESKNKDIDLIVMGTRAEHDGMEALLGTRASDVIEAATVPVLVIPENVTSFNPSKIGFAADLGEIKNSKTLKFISDFTKNYHAEVLIFSVAKHPDELSEKEQKQMEELLSYFDKENASCRTVESGSVKEGIKNFIEAHELDILVMIPRERSFLEKLFRKSITKAIAVETSIPLLSFHE
ncbi:MAG: universal stress protein [Cyclobacteriaceae bacterium]